MKKKLLSLVLVLAMALTLLPTAAFAEEVAHEENGANGHTVTWTDQGDGTCKPSCAVTECVFNTTAAAADHSFGDWADSVKESGKRAKICTNTGCGAEDQAHECAVGQNTAWSTGADGKRVQACGTCGAEINAHTCNTSSDGACSVCGYRAPAGDIELTVTAGAAAAQEENFPRIKTSITIDPGKDMEASVLKNAVRVSASVGNDAKAQNLVVSLPNASTKAGTAQTFEATFTMPGEAANVTAETTVTLKVTPAEGYTLAGAVNNALTLTTKLSSYAKPGGGEEDPAPTAAFKSLTMIAANKAELKVTLANIAEDMSLAVMICDSTKLAGGYEPTMSDQTVDVTAGATSAAFTFTGLSAGTYYIIVQNQEAALCDELEDMDFEDPTTWPAPHTLAPYKAPAKPSKPTAPETPKDEDKAPGTNSQGIPVASQVSSRKQADAAIKTLKNTNAEVLQERLMTSDSALSSFRSLERAVKSAKDISVVVETERNAVPSAVRSGVDIDGAAFNANSSTVRLVVDAPSRSYAYNTGYQISMTLTGVRNAASLDVPVIITLPLPTDVSASRVVVLHYHDSGSKPEVIVPAVVGNYIRFPVTGFSDFVVADEDDYDVPSGGGYLGGNAKKDTSNMDIILPAIVAMLSHDGVFADVPGTHWAVNEIRWARNGGLMSGYDNGEFRPWADTTRQQLWMVLARLAGARPADMEAARQWAVNTGVSDGTNPHGVLSRQQLVTMLYRFAKTRGADVSASAKLGGYADSRAVASYAKDAFSWAVAKGIVGGDANGRLNPENTATRAHFAVLLYRYSSNV
nr:S-layer homology domain-containing protein [uncultured Oscillibacter sp.]